MEMRPSICRSIIESHGGSFSASSKNVYRAIFKILSVAAVTEHE
jgi:hypothetical protein